MFYDSRCQCGETLVRITRTPTVRLCCHCTTCQAVYGKPCSDVTVQWARNVEVEKIDQLRFKRHHFPFLLNRGTCPTCNDPVVAFLSVLPFLRMAFVPTYNYQTQEGLPEPQAHIFYHRRIADVKTQAPKISGFLKSQLKAFGILTSLLSTQRR